MREYLATWMGHVTGSFAGRDDGYPEEKSRIISVEDIPLYEKHAQFKLYSLMEVSPKDIKALSDEVQNKKKKVECAKHQAKLTALSKLSPSDKKILGL